MESNKNKRNIIISKGTNIEYGYGHYGLGLYMYNTLGKVVLFIGDSD